MSEFIKRRAVRAAIIDPQGHILMMKARDPASAHDVWFTPGGGAVPGENPETTLRRELLEETGIDSFQIGPCIWTRTHLFDWGGRVIDQSEVFFLIESDRFDPVMSDADPNEASQFIEFRWWSADTIDDSSAIFAPRRLANALRRLLDEGPPTAPFDVGV